MGRNTELPVSIKPPNPSARSPGRTFTLRHIILAYAAGVLSVLLLKSLQRPTLYAHPAPRPLLGSTRSGATEVHQYPPSAPTNAFPSLFPSNVGYAGPTPTGAEPALVATAPSYPIHTGAPHLLPPNALSNDTKFDIFTHLGNLSPWFTVKPGTFGVHAGPEPPRGCRITGLHLLHRHGARYPTGSSTAYGGPASLAARLHDAASPWHANGPLSFLNDW